MFRKHFGKSVSLVLVTAAILKLHQLLLFPAGQVLVLNSRLLTVLLIQTELFLAVLLWFGAFHRHSRCFGLFLFAIFLCVTSYNLYKGASECGCFGIIKMHPIVSLMVNALVLFLLWFWERPVFELGFWGKSCGFGVVLGIIVMIPAAVSTQTFRTIDQRGQLQEGDGFVIVDFQKLVGKLLPLQEHLIGSKDWIQGKCTLIFFRNDCSTCQEIIKKRLSHSELVPVFFIELPPHLDVSRADNSSTKWLKLSNNVDWLIDVPTIVELKDGVVLQVIN